MTSFMNKLDLLSYEEVRDILDEIKNQLFHLERSQKELLEALEEYPGDDDFAEAYRENMEVIDRKRDTFNQMLDHLESLDPSFRRDQYENLNTRSETTVVTTAVRMVSTGPVQLDDSENEEEDFAIPEDLNRDVETNDDDNNNNNNDDETTSSEQPPSAEGIYI